ncbi:MAG: hypothetical protein M1827_006385 [Pycnora praestabilis]|nr:MAG: hypothetical protein M1827_006385 [Pycnora praestabilis]
MAAIQLNFSLRTSSNCKTVHLLGSWDNYNGQLPLSKDQKPGSWKGTFRFQGATLKQGQRYWYYYIIDGYHVSHDPAQASTTEPTTQRTLNILDVPAAGKSSSTAAPAKSSRSARNASVDIAKGRPLSQSEIKHPKPVKPNQTRHLTQADYTAAPTVEQLASRFSTTTIGGEDADEYYSSSPSSLSSGSSRSSPSSLSSLSDSSGASACTCERYGITRKGDRVKLDCGGSRCGYSDDSSECSSEDDYELPTRSTRRQGVVIRK